MADTSAGQPYSPSVGLIFIFNLIVGTGALAMPLAFSEAGWLNSLILVCVLALMSYVTSTFTIEAMAVANALLRCRRVEAPPNPTESRDSNDEQRPLLFERERQQPIYDVQDNPIGPSSDVYNIKQRVEMGKMAGMFFHKIGVITFYCCISIYLYGDLAIYAAAVPKSFRNVVCTYTGNAHSNHSHESTGCNPNLTNQDLCWNSHPSLTRGDAYRIFVAVFAMTVGVFVFFNVQKTKFLQLFTATMRWLAFAMMIVLCIIQLSKDRGVGDPKVMDFAGLPTLFGVCVYSFMCHHSLPTLVTPITNKSRIYSLFAADYVLILGFYCLLSFTGIFTFKKLEDIYTLNFLCDSNKYPITSNKFIEYFLALFPVFTLSTSFPIIAISLRNNIKTLFHRENKPYHWIIDRLLFPLAAICPPILVAFMTDNVQMLVSITGSYAGASIQYFIPAGLVFFARRQVKSHELLSTIENRYASPLKHTAWVIAVFIWAVISVIFVTVNHIIERT